MQSRAQEQRKGSALDRIMMHRNRKMAEESGHRRNPPRALSRFPGFTALPLSISTNPCDHRAPGISFPHLISRPKCELFEDIWQMVP